MKRIKTASGYIASFSDPIGNMPLYSLRCNVEPRVDGIFSVTVYHAKKNLMPSDIEWTQGIRLNNGSYSESTASHYSAPIKVNPSTDYTIQGAAYPALGFRIYYLQKDETWIERTASYTTDPYTFTTPANCEFIQVQCKKGTTATDIQIEKGATATEFEAYSVESQTVSLGRMIYEGNPDVVKGICTTNYACMRISDLTWKYESGNARFVSGYVYGMEIASAVRTLQVMAQGYTSIYDGRPNANVPDLSIYNVSESNNPEKIAIVDSNYTSVEDFLQDKGNIEIIFPLETPVTFTFTPITINTKFGINNIWSSVDSVDALYYIIEDNEYKTKMVSGSVVSFSDGIENTNLCACKLSKGPMLDPLERFYGYSSGYNMINWENIVASSASTMITKTVILPKGTYYIYVFCESQSFNRGYAYKPADDWSGSYTTFTTAGDEYGILYYSSNSYSRGKNRLIIYKPVIFRLALNINSNVAGKRIDCMITTDGSYFNDASASNLPIGGTIYNKYYKSYVGNGTNKVYLSNNTNLFDKTKKDTSNGYVSGKYLTSNGNTGSNVNWYISEYIEIEAEKNYVLDNCTGVSPSIVFYNSSKQKISGISYSGNAYFNNIISPTNTKYCRLSIQTANESNVLFKKVTLFYGGTFDIINGTGTTDYVRIDLGSLSWINNVNGNANVFDGTIPTSYQPDNRESYICEDYSNATSTTVISTDMSIAISDDRFVLYCHDNRYTEAEDFKAAVQGKYIVFKCTSQKQDFNFIPINLNIVEGLNQVWTNVDDIDVTYYIPGDEVLEQYFVKGTTLTNIADAIRTVKGTQSPIDVDDFIDEIDSMNLPLPSAEEVEF